MSRLIDAHPFADPLRSRNEPTLAEADFDDIGIDIAPPQRKPAQA